MACPDFLGHRPMNDLRCTVGIPHLIPLLCKPSDLVQERIQLLDARAVIGFLLADGQDAASMGDVVTQTNDKRRDIIELTSLAFVAKIPNQSIDLLGVTNHF